MNEQDWLDEQIDRLWQERRPASPADDATAELLAVVVAGKRLGAQAAPSVAYMRKAGHDAAGVPGAGVRPPLTVRLARYAVVAAVAASLGIGITFLPQVQSRQVVHAMEKAVTKLTAYHAVIEHRVENSSGTEIRREEIWVRGNQYHYERVDPLMGTQLVISDGEREWTVLPKEKIAYHGYPVAADLKEWRPAALAKKVVSEPYTIDGSDTVAGRDTVRVTVRPATEGSGPYQVWIDKETKLPLQYHGSYGGADGYQSTTTYTVFDLNPVSNPSQFSYQPPADYRVVEGGSLVRTAEDAARITGFKPVMPKEQPKRMIASTDGITLDFGDASIVAQKMESSPRLHPVASYGWSAAGPVEFHTRGSLIWFQDGQRIMIQADSHGDRAIELARQILPDLSLPLEIGTTASFNRQAKQDVMPDMKHAMAMEQERAKNPALYPERADAKAVALQFLKSQGAQVDAAALTETGNMTIEVVYDVKAGPIRKVFLRQVARNDGRGLWWVIGYDPR